MENEKIIWSSFGYINMENKKQTAKQNRLHLKELGNSINTLKISQPLYPSWSLFGYRSMENKNGEPSWSLFGYRGMKDTQALGGIENC